MLDLFSGIGGFSLAASWTGGIETVAFCEIEPYCQKVLKKYWPDVPIYPDIKQLRSEDIGSVDIVCGGFPCQPFSVAGKQKGKRDDRYLWPEMLRVIREIKPTWVLGENVPGILRIAGKTVCEDLEREGYAVTVFNFEAAAVGAPHRRDRVFFVAHSRCPLRQGGIIKGTDANEDREGTANITERPSCPSKANVADTDHTGNRTPPSRIDGNGQEKNKGWEEQPLIRACRCGENVANTSCKLREWDRRARDRRVEPNVGGMVNGIPYWLDGYWRVEPDIPRVATGVKNREDRLKCLGNAVVPQQVYPILQGIVDIENN